MNGEENFDLEIKLVIDEIKFLKEKYKINRISFCDANFTINKRHVEGVCKEILREGIDLKWSIQTRCDLVDHYILKLIKKAGCEFISFGVETFSKVLQRKIKKYLTSNSIVNAITLSKKMV